MRVHGIDHVQVAMPAGGEPQARAFYGGILGLGEVAKPKALAGRGGVWFARDGVEIHVGVEDGFRPVCKAHPALLVQGLDELVAACRAAGYDVQDAIPLEGRRRVYVADPFGNRIEMIEQLA